MTSSSYARRRGTTCCVALTNASSWSAGRGALRTVRGRRWHRRRLRSQLAATGSALSMLARTSGSAAGPSWLNSCQARAASAFPWPSRPTALMCASRGAVSAAAATPGTARMAARQGMIARRMEGPLGDGTGGEPAKYAGPATEAKLGKRLCQEVGCYARKSVQQMLGCWLGGASCTWVDYGSALVGAARPERMRRAWAALRTGPTPFASMLRACHPTS